MAQQPLKVVGLLGDRFLINNPIKVTIASLDNPIYFKIVLENLSNTKTSTDLIIYPDSNANCQVDLKSIVKSLFDYPEDASGYIINNQVVKNANKYKISIWCNALDILTDIPTGEELGYEQVKTFIRGGNRTNDTNQTVAGLSILTPSNKLPVWTGYDTAEYYLDSNNDILKRLLLDVPASRIDYRRSKGCNEVYVKFLNQRGGYSNWLFESHAKTESNNNQGGFERDNKIDDLGNESENKLVCNSKVPKDYKQLMLDLIVSPEVYVMNNGLFERVRCGRNSMPYDNIKRTYNVNINFDLDYRFDPTLLW